jgi:hypothetical protein
MQKLCFTSLLALTALISLSAMNSASASQLPMHCGMDKTWDPQSQSCVGRRPLGPCQPGQFGRLCNPNAKPARCNRIRYDPSCDGRR